MKNVKIDSEMSPMGLFSAYLQTQGLRNTPQRRCIVEVFLRENGHPSIEDIYAKALKVNPEVGQATIYRTMRLLCEAGIARELQFGDGAARYEKTDDSHHDHLICEICGKKVEVVDPTIEQLQVGLARKHGYRPTYHRLYLFGVCPECIQAENQPQASIPKR